MRNSGVRLVAAASLALAIGGVLGGTIAVAAEEEGGQRGVVGLFEVLQSDGADAFAGSNSAVAKLFLLHGGKEEGGTVFGHDSGFVRRRVSLPSLCAVSDTHDPECPADARS